MDAKRLDLDAPLLSFRRITVPSEELALPPLQRRKALPFYNSRSGAIPFDWETTPGQPKDSSLSTSSLDLNPAPPKLPPGRSLKQKATVCGEEEEEEDDDDAFADARDAFSCAESFSVKCGMSGGAGAEDPLRSFGKEFMMGRFLPAAKAMAEDSPQRIWRKPARAYVDEGDCSGSRAMRRRLLPLDYQYQLSRAQLRGTEQEEEEGYDEGFFSSKGCGLMQRFCLRSSIGGLNPVPVFKAQGRFRPRTYVLNHGSMGKAEDEDSWEEVYRYKLSRGYCYRQREDESKLMTESNQLTSWSDSQMLDGSSFFNSSGGALSPEKHEDLKRESGSWKTGSSDLCEKVYGETTYGHDRLRGSGSMSPATERALNQNSLSLLETPDCKLVSANIDSDTKTMVESAGNSSAVEDEFQQTEESVVAEPGFSSCSGRLNGVDIYDNDFNNDDGFTSKVALLEKNDNSLALSLLPPPLPTSPSESWLQRALPSVSSRGSHQQSFLGIHLHPKKQVSWASAGGHKSVTYEKPSNMHSRRTRFVEVAKGT